ncbi:MAG: CRISPR-associated protein Cas5 [Desulfovibrio sp.]|jgi:CRISPR-associated protein Cas5d|nr:CRISPR-associated protein Cas5 [Desulfovibrio sp.]
MLESSYTVKMEIAGNTAMWTRPDSGDCPVSYPVPTYSAAKAIFESILWGPAIAIVPIKVEICTPVQYHSYLTNYGGPLRSTKSLQNGNSYQLLATVLIDVCYKLYAKVRPNRDKCRLPPNALRWDSNTTSPGHAYQAMFYRRLKRGQCYSIPVLGWREFTPSYFGELRDDTKILSSLPDINISSMLREVFNNGYNSPVSFIYDRDVAVRNGCLNYGDRG